MTDKEMLITLCQHLGLSEITKKNWNVPHNALGYGIVNEPDGLSFVTINEGDEGYLGFHVTFVFNPDGSAKSHMVYE